MYSASEFDGDHEFKDGHMYMGCAEWPRGRALSSFLSSRAQSLSQLVAAVFFSPFPSGPQFGCRDLHLFSGMQKDSNHNGKQRNRMKGNLHVWGPCIWL